MRECWINVYYSPYAGVWYGNCFYTRKDAPAKGYNLLYRIHVRMKSYPDERMIAY